jgi:UDP-glucose 4-epimerase
LAYAVSAVAELCQRITGRATLLNLDKYQELKQQNWVCDGYKARSELNFQTSLSVEAALLETWRWYQKAGWL